MSTVILENAGETVILEGAAAEEYLNEAVRRYPNEPKSLFEHLKKTYSPEDFSKLSKDSIEKAISSKSKLGIQKEWISYMKKWNQDEGSDYEKAQNAKIAYMEKLNIVPIWKDGAGTELGCDVNSKKVYCYDHNYGFMSSSISINKLLKLKGE